MAQYASPLSAISLFTALSLSLFSTSISLSLFLPMLVCMSGHLCFSLPLYFFTSQSSLAPLTPISLSSQYRSPGYWVWIELLFRVGLAEELDSHHSEDVDDHAEHKREVTQSSQRTEDDGEQHAHRGPSLRQAEDTEQTQLNKKRDSVTTMN